MRHRLISRASVVVVSRRRLSFPFLTTILVFQGRGGEATVQTIYGRLSAESLRTALLRQLGSPRTPGGSDIAKKRPTVDLGSGNELENWPGLPLMHTLLQNSQVRGFQSGRSGSFAPSQQNQTTAEVGREDGRRGQKMYHSVRLELELLFPIRHVQLSM